ncbi:MAG: hypothetical protein ACRC6M_13790, partial [Microcystaceae cyanobacterium]
MITPPAIHQPPLKPFVSEAPSRQLASQNPQNRNSLFPTLTANSGNLLPPPPSSPKPIPTSGWGMTPANNVTRSTPPVLAPLFSNPPSRGLPTPSLSSLPANNTQSYRVLAAISNPVQQEQLKSIYPEAFNTSYNGQRLLQVGRFSSRENAEQASQNLQGVG